METTITVNAQTLAHALRCVAPSASDDSTRPFINCVQVKVNGVLDIAATNGHVLTKYTAPLIAVPETHYIGAECEILIPRDSAVALEKAIRKADASWPPVELTSTGAKFLNGSLAWSELKDPFPPADRVIPPAAGERLTGTARIGLSHDYLAAVGKAFATFFGHKRGGPTLTLPSDELSPVRFDGETYLDGHHDKSKSALCYVVMPIRI